MTNAADRVEAFLDMRKRLPNLHEDLITGIGHEGGIAALLVSDLRDLIGHSNRLESLLENVPTLGTL